jgi:type III secretion system FlhB-like substrate exporter
MNKLPRFAIALEYDGKQAPLVTAKGHDEIANRILQLAHEANVPIQKDNELALVLDHIPTDCRVNTRTSWTISKCTLITAPKPTLRTRIIRLPTGLQTGAADTFEQAIACYASGQSNTANRAEVFIEAAL